MLCQKCGAGLNNDAEFCNSCGAPVARKPDPPVQTDTRNPWQAVAFSFVVPGWGQWYNGKTVTGLKFFGVFLILIISMYIAKFANIYFLSGMAAAFLLLGISLVWVYGLYDAYKTAERINKGEERFSGKSRLFWLGACFLILVFLFPFVLSAVFMSEMSHDYGSMTTEKIVSVSAQKPDANHIVVTFQGGQDASQLIDVLVTVDGTTQRMVNADQASPLTVGSSTTFTGNYSGETRIIGKGHFEDNTEETLLDTTL
jgi:hypothetical protein